MQVAHPPMCCAGRAPSLTRGAYENNKKLQNADDFFPVHDWSRQLPRSQCTVHRQHHHPERPGHQPHANGRHALSLLHRLRLFAITPRRVDRQTRQQTRPGWFAGGVVGGASGLWPVQQLRPSGWPAGVAGHRRSAGVPLGSQGLVRMVRHPGARYGHRLGVVLDLHRPVPGATLTDVIHGPSGLARHVYPHRGHRFGAGAVLVQILQKQSRIHGRHRSCRAGGGATESGAETALDRTVQGAQHLGRVSRLYGRDLHDLAQPDLAAGLL